MTIPVRLALGFVLSFGLAALLQRAVLAGFGGGDRTTILALLAGLVALIAAVFALVVRRRRTAARVSRAALATLAALAALGLGLYAAGTLMGGPGIGGRIAADLAALVDLTIVLPAAVAIPVHWLLLRRAPP